MFTFLRKISFRLLGQAASDGARESSITSGSTRAYILYAFGEVLLVMIGILLALQVNNWNEDRKHRRGEIHILEAIQADLEVNISALEDDLYAFYGADSRIRSGRIILNHLDNRLPYHDSLAFHFVNTMDYSWESPVSAGYETLKSTGANLISNKSLQNKIAFYFSAVLSNHQFQFSVIRQEYYHYVLDLVNTLFEKAQFQYDSKEKYYAIPDDYKALLSNKEYRRKIRGYHDLNIHYQKELMETMNQTKA